MAKFTQEQVLEEVRQVQTVGADLHGSEVYEAWMEMAGEWLLEDNHAYLKYGFEGFFQRTPEIILCDFHFAKRLTVPLTGEQVDRCLGTCPNDN